MSKIDLLPSRSELLKEYELCVDQVSSIENRIWTSTSIIGFGAIGSVLVDPIVKAELSFYQLSILALSVFGLTWIWWKIACRWWDIEHSRLQRMRDIESELDLYMVRYASYKDGIIHFTKDTPPKPHRKGLHYDPGFAKGAVKGNIKYVVSGVYLLWIIILLIKWLSLSPCKNELMVFHYIPVVLYLFFGGCLFLGTLIRVIYVPLSTIRFGIALNLSNLSSSEKRAIWDRYKVNILQ